MVSLSDPVYGIPVYNTFGGLASSDGRQRAAVNNVE